MASSINCPIHYLSTSMQIRSKLNGKKEFVSNTTTKEVFQKKTSSLTFANSFPFMAMHIFTFFSVLVHLPVTHPSKGQSDRKQNGTEEERALFWHSFPCPFSCSFIVNFIASVNSRILFLTVSSTGCQKLLFQRFFKLTLTKKLSVKEHTNFPS